MVSTQDTQSSTLCFDPAKVKVKSAYKEPGACFSKLPVITGPVKLFSVFHSKGKV